METVSPPHSGVSAVGSVARNALYCLLAITPVIALLSAFIVTVPVSLLCYAVASAHYRETFGTPRNILSIARLISIITVFVSVIAIVLLLTFRDPVGAFTALGAW